MLSRRCWEQNGMRAADDDSTTRRRQRQTNQFLPDYPLQGSSLDVPISDVLALTDAERARYVRRLVVALGREIRADRMTLKARVPFKREMRDLRQLLTLPVDTFLYTNDKTYK